MNNNPLADKEIAKYIVDTIKIQNILAQNDKLLVKLERFNKGKADNPQTKQDYTVHEPLESLLENSDDANKPNDRINISVIGLGKQYAIKVNRNLSINNIKALI